MEATNKEATMTFRVEPDLRADFSAAAERENRPAAQILRDFMRSYVEKTRPRISKEERAYREYLVKEAFTSAEMEGCIPTERIKMLAQRLIEGEISIDDFVRG